VHKHGIVVLSVFLNLLVVTGKERG